MESGTWGRSPKGAGPLRDGRSGRLLGGVGREEGKARCLGILLVLLTLIFALFLRLGLLRLWGSVRATFLRIFPGFPLL
jgi:hypothetical protein